MVGNPAMVQIYKDMLQRQVS